MNEWRDAGCDRSAGAGRTRDQSGMPKLGEQSPLFCVAQASQEADQLGQDIRVGEQAGQRQVECVSQSAGSLEIGL